MTPEQTATLQYWQKRFPRQFAIAARANGVTGFGQTSTFNDVLSSLTGLLTSYGQYKVASDIATSGTAANRGLLALPGSGVTGTGTTNWILYGGIGLVAVVGIVLFTRKKK